MLQCFHVSCLYYRLWRILESSSCSPSFVYSSVICLQMDQAELHVLKKAAPPLPGWLLVWLDYEAVCTSMTRGPTLGRAAECRDQVSAVKKTSVAPSVLVSTRSPSAPSPAPHPFPAPFSSLFSVYVCRLLTHFVRKSKGYVNITGSGSIIVRLRWKEWAKTVKAGMFRQLRQWVWVPVMQCLNFKRTGLPIQPFNMFIDHVSILCN